MPIQAAANRLKREITSGEIRSKQPEKPKEEPKEEAKGKGGKKEDGKKEEGKKGGKGADKKAKAPVEVRVAFT